MVVTTDTVPVRVAIAQGIDRGRDQGRGPGLVIRTEGDVAGVAGAAVESDCHDGKKRTTTADEYDNT